ncbi:MAG: hypothetical protein HOE11_00830 [Candidatus Diapherotrites archaeon]|nr:hypothetical protein [Candidatus Diapherotrites archaeon]MBT4596770.1 hypothetical protein [Candidatus Diapherotrites archaeon]
MRHAIINEFKYLILLIRIILLIRGIIIICSKKTLVSPSGNDAWCLSTPLVLGG